MLLDSTFGFIGYLFLPNDYVWKLLTPDERERVKRANFEHNNYRPDYANPASYGGGQSFNSQDDREMTRRGRVIKRFLDRVRPTRVIEVGPGSGYYTQQIVEHASVREYVAIDINARFLDFIRERLEGFHKPGGLECEFIAGDASSIANVRPADCVILLSALHHIPDRDVALASFASMLRNGGEILAIDPTHYLPRVINLLAKCWSQGYLKQSFRDHPTNISTHHFCTIGELNRICRRTPQLSLVDLDMWNGGRRVPRWWSREMAACIRVTCDR